MGVVCGIKRQGREHIALGVSAEDQDRLKERSEILLQIDSAIRYVSIEPMLGPMTVAPYLKCDSCLDPKVHWCVDPVINWVILGGENGNSARPMNPAWARAVRDECVEAGVPFFFKGWGAWVTMQNSNIVRDSSETYPPSGGRRIIQTSDGKTFTLAAHNVRRDMGPEEFYRVGKKKSGRLLDGREWNQTPWDKE